MPSFDVGRFFNLDTSFQLLILDSGPQCLVFYYGHSCLILITI